MRAFALLGSAADIAAARVAATLGETVALGVAPDLGEATERFRAASAAGATRLVRVWDPVLENTDYLGLATVLAQAVRTLSAESAEPWVVVCGESGHAAMGPAVAERLTLPHLGAVVGVQVADGRLMIKRRAGGVMRLYAGAPPFVLCVTVSAVGDQAARPRGQEGTGEVETLGLERLGLSVADVAHRRRFRLAPAPGPTAAPRRFPDAAQLAARLKADGLVPGGD